MLFNARPANGAPDTVGTDISTIQRLRSVKEPEEVACEADGGRMICNPECSDMTTDEALLKLGARIMPRATAMSSL